MIGMPMMERHARLRWLLSANACLLLALKRYEGRAMLLGFEI